MKVTPHRKPYQYPYFVLRLLLGILTVCAATLGIAVGLAKIGLVAWHADVAIYSVLAVGVIYMASMTSLRRMNYFPGADSLVAPIPILLMWYIVVLGVHFLLQLPYHIIYIAFGFFLSVVCLTVQTYLLRKTYQLQLAFVPIGRAQYVNQIPGAIWTVLENPSNPLPSHIHAIVVDLHAPDLSDEWQRFLAQCSLQQILVYNIRQVEEALTGRVKIHHMYENNLGSLLPSKTYMDIKYVLECLIIVLSLPIVLPIMLITAIAIKYEDGGRVFYKQERVGYCGQSFMIYKFRSMTEDENINSHDTTRVGDTRITRIGQFIRKMRIDELPQFLNVIKGEMALIGPRAEFKKFADDLEKQVPFYQYRHIVKPGITGWAQVMHGYATGADETQIKIEFDFYYIKYFSFWLDVVIVLKTIGTILTGFGSR